MRTRTESTTIAAVASLVLALVTLADAAAPRRSGERSAAAGRRPFTATAYALSGRTADGGRARPGIVAADLRVLPLGTRIRVSDAGAYSGDYQVADTGAAVKGTRIDIYVPSARAARTFGRRRVQVEVLPSP